MNSLKNPERFSPTQALLLHWPEYLIEAWALGMFMISAAVVTTELESPRGILHGVVLLPAAQRVLIGVAMGSTAVALIYCPWGRRSGAHMNPAVTLAFWSLGRVSPINAVFYLGFQFLGGLLGVLIAWGWLGANFSEAPVSFIVTQPGHAGSALAFAAEFLISFALMLTILVVSNDQRWSRFTGGIAGCLIAAYVAIESPLSGMSMNPARTLASALPAGVWDNLWIYFAAPIAAMWLAARVFHVWTPWMARTHHGAKIVPTADHG
jgi:aquaporin Z